MRKIFFVVFVFILFFPGCREEDYREKFVGTYEFTTIDKYSRYGDSIPKIDTIIQPGAVSYDNNTEDLVLIDFYYKVRPIVNSDGNLFFFPPPSPGESYSISGKFENNNKVKFIWEYKEQGGLGAGYRIFDVSGIKK